MFEIQFEVKKAEITDVKEDRYYLIALADHESEPSNYLIFQKTYCQEELEEDSELNGAYIECNGESCYDCCHHLVLNGHVLSFEVKGTKFFISLDQQVVNLAQFVEYMNRIFGTRLVVK